MPQLLVRWWKNKKKFVKLVKTVPAQFGETKLLTKTKQQKIVKNYTWLFLGNYKKEHLPFTTTTERSWCKHIFIVHLLQWHTENVEKFLSK